MNNIPTMMLTTGFKTDQNGILTELDVPNVVATLNAPTKIVFNGTAINYVPSDAATLTEFTAPNCTTIISNAFKGYNRLTTLNLPALQTISDSGGDSGLCYGCTGLTSISLSSLETIAVTANTYAKLTGSFLGCTGLTSINLPNLTSLSVVSNQSGSTSGVNGGGSFYGCTGLTSINLPNLTTLTADGLSGGNLVNVGSFYGCTGLTSINLPELRTINATGGVNKSTAYIGSFANCTGLVTVNLPKLNTATETSNYGGTFKGCTSLESVQLGSEGYPVSAIGAYMFNGCTQSGLTITIYTADGNALANSPFGATNATIVWEEA